MCLLLHFPTSYQILISAADEMLGLDNDAALFRESMWVYICYNAHSHSTEIPPSQKKNCSQADKTDCLPSPFHFPTCSVQIRLAAGSIWGCFTKVILLYAGISMPVKIFLDFLYLSRLKFFIRIRVSSLTKYLNITKYKTCFI